jgi:hypothetical protein
MKLPLWSFGSAPMEMPANNGGSGTNGRFRRNSMAGFDINVFSGG